jgi:hypothetical protein
VGPYDCWCPGKADARDGVEDEARMRLRGGRELADPWHVASMMTMATVCLGSNDGVCGSPGVLARLLASGEGEWWRGASALVTFWRVQGARRARTGACMGMPGRVWARWFLAVAVKKFDGAVSGRDQVSERRVIDMVMLAGSGQREEWHGELMPCHGMVLPWLFWSSRGTGKWRR